MAWYTAHAEYFATGEGVTHMLLVGNGFENEDAVKERFAELFSDYYAIGVEIKEGIDWSWHQSDVLVSDLAKKTVEKWANGKDEDAPYFEWYSSFYYNFS